MGVGMCGNKDVWRREAATGGRAADVHSQCTSTRKRMLRYGGGAPRAMASFFANELNVRRRHQVIRPHCSQRN